MKVVDFNVRFLQYFRYCKSHIIRFAAFKRTIYVWASCKEHVSTWTVKPDLMCLVINPSAWGHLNPSSYCDVGRLFYGVFKLWSKLQSKK